MQLSPNRDYLLVEPVPETVPESNIVIPEGVAISDSPFEFGVVKACGPETSWAREGDHVVFTAGGRDLLEGCYFLESMHSLSW